MLIEDVSLHLRRLTGPLNSIRLVSRIVPEVDRSVTVSTTNDGSIFFWPDAREGFPFFPWQTVFD